VLPRRGARGLRPTSGLALVPDRPSVVVARPVALPARSEARGLVRWLGGHVL